MKQPIQLCLRCFADWLVRMQRYRYLRAHLWDDAINEMKCGTCT